MAEANKAVFLSYASQDAEAARRICEALRAHGIEVWFDQSELRGGDAWDAKIRKQIKECALFVPVISANTQARPEGYFRLEWRLADQRTHLMGKTKSFLLPVCVDDTREGEADVPDSFLTAQWTRLPGGDASESFCARVKVLLGGKVDGELRGPSATNAGVNAPSARVSPRNRRTLLAALVCIIFSAALAVWRPWRAGTPGDTSPRSAAAKTSDEVAKLRGRLIPDQWRKEDFEPWSAALDKIIAADDQNADAWALRSIINSLQVMRTYDAGTKPLEAGRAAAQRALLLAPNSAFAELALGMHHAAMISRGGDPQTARAHLNRASVSLPPDPLTRYADLTTAWFGYDFDRVERTAEAWLDSEPNADFPAYILGLMNFNLRNATEASRWSKRAGSDKGVTGIRALCVAAETDYYVRADLAAVRAKLDQVPADARAAIRVVYARWLLAMAERHWDLALQELARTPESVFFETGFYGPKAMLAGLTHEAAGRTDVALAQYREAERILRELLAGDSQNEPLHALMASTLAHSGRAAEARNELGLVEPQLRGRPRGAFTGRLVLLLAQAHAALGDIPDAVTWLRELLSGPTSMPFTPASLRVDPRFQAILPKPEVQALLTEFAHLDAPKTPVTTPPANSSAPDPKSIAVLPFENLGGEADATGFTDGMHEEVLTALAKIAALKVIGRTSVLPYRDAAKRDLRKISADLNVGSVVEGTVRRAGNKVRIAVKLEDTQTSRQLWAQAFEQELTDVFAIQTAVAEEVATTLRATFTANERAAIDRRPTENARAYELYLQAKVLDNDLNNTSPLRDWERAVQLLEQAVGADPNFAHAYALLARTQASISWHGSLDPTPARRELARKALEEAQRLAPNAAETHFAEGRFAYTSNRDFDATMRYYRAALAELPNDSSILYNIGLTHRQLGQLVEAVPPMTQAHELNPLDISNAGDLVISLLVLRRFQEAARIGSRYNGSASELRTIVGGTAIARYELDGDRTRLVTALRKVPFYGTNDVDGAFTAFQAAYRAGEIREAENVLAKHPRLTAFPGLQNAMSDPVALYRAQIAKLLSHDEEAAARANEAESYLRGLAPSARQKPFVALGLVRAAAYAGRKGEALKLADVLRRDLGSKRGVDEIAILNEIGAVYALIDARDEALALLRALMTGPGSPHAGTPRMIRLDPCWSKLADDPRFDEILKAAKPL